jgi:protein-S-isoprenylcysteine O-methyltransferase Ste14
MSAPPSAPPQPTSPPSARTGFFYKPLIEQLKLIALFVLIGALVYFSAPTRNSFLAGAILVAIGTVIRVWAAGHLTRDQRLTTSGPYQYTRNPFYLGRFLWIIGFAVMSGLGADLSQTRNIVLWVIVGVALIFFFAFYMPRKERREGGRLREMFGPDYETWKSHVPSLFPRPTPYVMNPRRWSRELFLGGDDQFSGNKELWTTIAVIGLVIAFLVRLETLR